MEKDTIVRPPIPTPLLVGGIELRILVQTEAGDYIVVLAGNLGRILLPSIIYELGRT